jgi:hypothetical protein
MYCAASATVVGNPTFVIVLPIWYCGRIRNKVAVFLHEALRLRMLGVLGEEPSGEMLSA